MFAVYCLLCVICCSLFVVYCVLFVVGCLWCVERCSLVVVGCMLLFVVVVAGCWLFPVGC